MVYSLISIGYIKKQYEMTACSKQKLSAVTRTQPKRWSKILKLPMATFYDGKMLNNSQHDTSLDEQSTKPLKKN